ncbi:MAG TPA: AsmA family protein [Frateuria sp.]|uniref:AsmA family protein n=1 Tax=Frateuria sp. TaxID=2211372 RepID=UPI002DF6EE01|nr:AsmA family protein [Frateuria sp.]
MTHRFKLGHWIAGVLAGLTVLLVIAVALFDWNRLKPFIDDKMSQAIGRPFAIRGDLSLAWRRDPALGGWHAWLPWPQFTARDIAIGNPPWASRPQFATLQSLRFELAPLPLFAHRIDVPTLQLVQPAVDLERDRQGRASWTFTLPQGGAPSAWKLELGAIGFDRGTVTLDDAQTASRLTVTVTPLQGAIPYDQIVAQQSQSAREHVGQAMGATAKKALAPTDQSDTAVGQHGAADYMFGWHAEGRYKGAPVKGDGRTGGVLALRGGGSPFPLQADVQLGRSRVALVGTLTDPLELGALDLRLWLSGPSMATLYPYTGVTLPDTPPYATEGHLQATLDSTRGNHFSYRHFHGRVGDSDIGGDVAFDTGGARPKLSGTLRSRLLRFADLGVLVGADSSAHKQQRGDATPQPPDKLLPVEPFRTDRWRAMDADVGFSGERIVRDKAVPLDALQTHIVMDAGKLTLEPLRFGLAGGQVQGALRLDGGKAPMQGRLDLSARHLKLKQLFPNVQTMRSSLGEINGEVQLGAQGNSVAALAGSADGQVRLVMNDGAISKTLLETAGLNVGNIVIGKLFGDQTVQINCAAADLGARNGLFDVRLFVFDTPDALVNMDGTVDMGSEKLDLTVKPHTKGLRVFSLRSPLYVRGTLKHPDVGVQKGPLLARGAGAVALGVVAAPAAALLALVVPSQDRNEGDNTCRATLQALGRKNAGSR